MLGQPRRVRAALRLPGLLRLVWFTALIALSGCAGAGPQSASNYRARDRIVAAVDAHDSSVPLSLRYNPAPCACPAFEVKLAGRWVRANWPGVRTAPWAVLAKRLAATSAPQWPIALRVLGRIDREVRRTSAGAYAVTIEVTELVKP